MIDKILRMIQFLSALRLGRLFGSGVEGKQVKFQYGTVPDRGPIRRATKASGLEREYPGQRGSPKILPRKEILPPSAPGLWSRFSAMAVIIASMNHSAWRKPKIWKALGM
jgi:hypothetical protein